MKTPHYVILTLAAVVLAAVFWKYEESEKAAAESLTNLVTANSEISADLDRQLYRIDNNNQGYYSFDEAAEALTQHTDALHKARMKLIKLETEHAPTAQKKEQKEMIDRLESQREYIMQKMKSRL